MGVGSTLAEQGERADEQLMGLAVDRSSSSVDRAIAAARELLGMDIAYIGEGIQTAQRLTRIQGDPSTFGLSEGLAIPWEETFCHHILEGRATQLTTDVRADPVLGPVPAGRVAGIGAFVSVPLQSSDGRVYGTLCAASHASRGDLGERDVNFVRVIARLISETLEREELEDERRRLQDQAVAGQALIAAVEARDSYTGRHSRTVVSLARQVSERLGLRPPEISTVEKVALLHDLGKLAIPDHILSKPGPLDDDEWEIMRRHPDVGAQVVRSIPGLAHLAAAIQAEHERWDGHGYPDGLVGEAIPIASRITLVCDAYDAMTSDRPYRAARPVVEARGELAAQAGAQFCPSCTEALLAALDRPARIAAA